MRGVYRIYRDGELVAESENLITDEGRKIVLRYLAGNIGSYADVLAVGTQNVLPTSADKRLGFEFARTNVELRIPNFADNSVTFKGSLAAQDAGSVYEVGLFPLATGNNTNSASRLITGFEPTTEPLSGGVTNTTNVRLGRESYSLNPAANGNATAVLSSLRTDFSGYGDDDSFSLAFFINDANTSSIRIRLLSDAGNYFEHSISGFGTNPIYLVREMRLGDFTVTGSPDWANITEAHFTVFAGAAATSVQLDGFRVNDTDIYPEYGLVSRTALASPVIKEPGQQLDIEYTLEFNI